MSNNKGNEGKIGEVDLCIAAALIIEEGFEVMGMTMKIWGRGTVSKECAYHTCHSQDKEENVKNAKKIAQIPEIPFYTFDLKQEYKTFVLDYFSHEYLFGTTPTPCAMCDQRLKFGLKMKKNYDNGIEFICSFCVIK